MDYYERKEKERLQIIRDVFALGFFLGGLTVIAVWGLVIWLT